MPYAALQRKSPVQCARLHTEGASALAAGGHEHPHRCHHVLPDGGGVRRRLDLFRISAIITALLIPLVWLTSKALNRSAAPAAGD